MSLFGDLGKVIGGIAGTAFGGPLGSLAGTAIGGIAGDALESLVGGGKRPSLEGALKDCGLPLPAGAGMLVNLVERNLGSIAGALGDKGDCGARNPGQIRDAVFDRMEGAIRDFGQGALPWLGRPCQPWPFPHLQPPRLPFCPVGPGVVQTPHTHGSDYKGLETNGKDTVDLGRYLLTCKEGSVKLFDKETNTWVKCHGDPHLGTSDGDKGQFHENLTLQLEDGSKVTIKTTPQNARSVAFIDSVAVMKGDQAVVISGFHDGVDGVRMGNVLNNRSSVDAGWEDGTVMVAGHQVDDLTFAANGRELIGGDPKARFGEHNLDGFGGAPRNSPAGNGDNANGARNEGPTFRLEDGTKVTVKNSRAAEAGPASGSNPYGFAPGDTLMDKLFKILAKLQEKLEGKPGANGEPDPKSAIGKLSTLKEGDQTGMQTAMFEIQKLQNMMKQVFETITNIQKSNDDQKEAIIRNFA